MTIKIIDPTPAKEVIKEVICKNCGVKLSYVPNDVKAYVPTSDWGDCYNYIKCPNCNKQVKVKG